MMAAATQPALRFLRGRLGEDGRSLGRLARLAPAVSKCSVVSCESQYSRSSASVLNAGIGLSGFLRLVIDRALILAHHNRLQEPAV